MSGSDESLRKRTAEYTLFHVVQVARELGEMVDDMQDTQIHPDRNITIPECLAGREKLIDEQVVYLQQVLKDFESIKSHGKTERGRR